MSTRPRSTQAWLLPYSTLMTLLFAVFLALYVSTSKRAAIAPVDPAPNSAPAPAIPDAGVADHTAGIDAHPIGEGKVVEAEYGVGVTQAGWKDIAQGMTQIFVTHYGSADLSKVLQIGTRKGTDLVLQILEEDFFPRGSFEVRPAMRPLLSRIGTKVAEGGFSVVIRVYASDQEKQPWMLATRRGAWVVDFLRERVKLPINRISVLARVYSTRVLEDTWEDGRQRSLELDLIRGLE